ncbi:MAG: helix-turn-helix domain-containing protein [Pontiellaceae bacterium]|nr:helix-turn-helix domain-containing protein [Pontiellaceae bacterium]
MSKINNDDLIRAIFTASDKAKETALEILEGRASAPGEPQDNGPLLLSMGEAAALLNISRATLWRTIKSGRIEKVELYPGSFRLRRSDLLALIGPRRSFQCGADIPVCASPLRKNPSSSAVKKTSRGGASC